MQGPVQWHLLYSPSSNPNNGAVVASGWLAPLKAGASSVISVMGQTGRGKYVFVIYQRPGTPSGALAYSDWCSVRGSNSAPTPIQ
jgi:hypothetical protein